MEMQILQGIASRTWNAIVEHAMRFVDDNKLYAFHIPQQGVSIYLDTIYKVVGANFNEQYFSVDEFTPAQKVPFGFTVIIDHLCS